MRIAVTYEDGKVFQHFGHTENFKLYDVEDDEIISMEVFNAKGTGHEALADFLAENDIDTLICGGLGAGAMNALTEAGIEVIAGAEGDADEAVKKYINGELESTGVNCDHHDHDEEEESVCTGSCGSCGGGCGGHRQIVLEGPNAGKRVSVHYVGTFNDGQKFDSSYDRGQTLDFICGAGMMIKGFDKAVVNMKVGEKVNIHLMPEEAYGPVDPEAKFTCEIAEMPGSEELNVGDEVYLYDQMRRPHRAKVVEKDAVTITFDTNHEMAGKELNFEIELISVQ